jgi:deazaflavin-dependent oxidoreductase (nitroreductase family)
MPDTDTARPWWKHPALRVVAVVVALRVVGVLVFRSHGRAVLDGVRVANKHLTNPLVLHRAGRPHGYAARLEHVGRRSGRPYATPVVARPVEGGVAIPLPYGTEVDWLRNLRAAGSGVLEVDGVRYTIAGLRIVSLDDVVGLSRTWRGLARLYGIRRWLTVTATAAAEARAGIGPPIALPSAAAT